jgi:hypothetical protein
MNENLRKAQLAADALRAQLRAVRAELKVLTTTGTWLARGVSMPLSAKQINLAEAVLISHQRLESGGCLCGWNRLGEIHARHVSERLAEAGVLR